MLKPSRTSIFDPRKRIAGDKARVPPPPAPSLIVTDLGESL